MDVERIVKCLPFFVCGMRRNDLSPARERKHLGGEEREER